MKDNVAMRSLLCLTSMLGLAGMFLAFHGSWNRAARVGYSVRASPSDWKPTAGSDFLTGFMLDPGKREVWGRPVGLLRFPTARFY